MLHSYQVLSVVRMERERQLERLQLLQAARASEPRREGPRRPGWLHGAALQTVTRRLSRRRPAVATAACC
jgi:hypothetical protein